MAGLLLAAGAMALDVLASPVLTGGAGRRDAPRGESWDDQTRSDKNLVSAERWWSLPPGAAFGDFHADIGGAWRGTGTEAVPFYGLETSSELPAEFGNTFGEGNALYFEFMRTRARTGVTAGSDLGLGGVIDSVLRSAWDSVADDNKTATFALAGIELSLTLRGDRRTLTLNGYDLSPLLQLSGLQGEDMLRGTPLISVAGEAPKSVAPNMTAVIGLEQPTRVPFADLMSTLEDISDFVVHPLTLLVVFTWLIVWLMVKILASLPERRSRHRYRHR